MTYGAQVEMARVWLHDTNVDAEVEEDVVNLLTVAPCEDVEVS